MVTMSARHNARAIVNRIFAFSNVLLTSSPNASKFHLLQARRRVLSMRNAKATLQVHHTSISCILSQYFEISKNLNFHNFLEKSAFFAIFADICSKTAKKFPTGNFFLKIRSDLKCVRIAPNCSKKVVRTLRESLRLA